MLKLTWALLKLTTTERISMLHFGLLINKLDCMSSRLYRRSPPSFPYLSYLYGTLKPFIWNWTVEKESSSLVSDIKSKSILFYKRHVSALNFFLTEFMFRWPNINLSGDWNLISLSPFLASLLSFSVADLWKTVMKWAYLSFSFSYLLVCYLQIMQYLFAWGLLHFHSYV